MSSKNFRNFNKVLIANRGEIACRIIKACHALNLKAVAVYSSSDENALHTRLADEAYCIGNAPPKESYLNISAILEAARKSGAEAIHPGYGFLSEKEDFAQAVLDANLVWIGPDPETIKNLGNKILAKELAQKNNIPTLSWAKLTNAWTKEDLANAAKKISFPLLFKAAAGGGGRGMRLVFSEQELFEKAESAMREALGAFGSGEIFLEKYCPKARHIEVQVLGDCHGNVITLGDRDCSYQRRHQKVVEEALAPNLTESTRLKLWDSAKNLARALQYKNAGTVEFLVDDNENFYFLEMNTRLQVEHPVSEIIFGVKIPELQLKISMGEPLPKELFEKKPFGHAIEARICAEDPEKNFMPSIGKITQFYFPQYKNLRFDTGFEVNSEISVHYDSMIGKLIAFGETREEARLLLLRALNEAQVLGIKWNGEFLKDLLNNPLFIEGKVYTKYIEEKILPWKPLKKENMDNENMAQNLNNLENQIENFLKTYQKKQITPWEYYAEDGSSKNLLSKKESSANIETNFDLNNEEILLKEGIVSEYPGKVLKVLFKENEIVKKGDIVIVCESMKIEFSYSAPFDAKIKKIFIKEGDIIEAQKKLVEWEKL